MSRNRYVQTTRSIARHLITRLGLAPTIAASKRWFGKDVRRRLGVGRAEAFRHIYRAGIWNRAQSTVPVSGPGSSLDATAIVRRSLPGLLETVGCQTLLDVGCGDQSWISALRLKQKYIGIDIVPELIEENRRLFPEREYHCLDAVTDDLPEADTVLCREVLFHLGLADGHSLIRNLARKQRRYLIATTDEVTLFNADIQSGDFRFLNLTRRPFRFPKPDYAIADDRLVSGRLLSVWRFDRLPV